MTEPTLKFRDFLDKRTRSWLAFAVLALLARYLVNLSWFDEMARYRPLIQKFGITAFLIFAVLVLGRVVQFWIKHYEDDEGNRYNLIRITRFVTLVFVVILALSFLFQNLYAAAASFGLISLVLGFALQTPIASFIAWLYIIFRKPYKVGDRIQLNGMRGDVVEIHYLDTTIQECSGDYLGNDQKSGRLIHFPNSIVLSLAVVNYSGGMQPFIWNETALHVAYTSDLDFVESCLLEAAEADFKERYEGLLQHPAYEKRASVYFRTNKYAWVEAVIAYLVEPEDTTGRRNRILRRAVERLNASSHKVQFPEGARR